MTDIKGLLRQFILSDQVFEHLETLRNMTKEYTAYLGSIEEKLDSTQQFLQTIREAVKRRSSDQGQVEIMNKLPIEEFVAVLKSREFARFLTEFLGTFVAYLKDQDAPRAGLSHREIEYTTREEEVRFSQGGPSGGVADETEEGVDGQGTD